jgi:hypothetical protein
VKKTSQNADVNVFKPFFLNVCFSKLKKLKINLYCNFSEQKDKGLEAFVTSMVMTSP